MGDLDKFLETVKTNKDITANINPSIFDNNTNINVADSNLHVNNFNINIPSSVGTAVGQAAGSVGLGATAVAGINGMARVLRKVGSMPPSARVV
jgi:hypothetical protein